MGKEHRQQKVESFLSRNDMRRPLHIPSSVSLGEHMCFIVLLFVLLMQSSFRLCWVFPRICFVQCYVILFNF